MSQKRDESFSKFWYEVERVMPDYRKYEKWLKDNGKILLAEIHGH